VGLVLGSHMANLPEITPVAGGSLRLDPLGFTHAFRAARPQRFPVYGCTGLLQSLAPASFRDTDRQNAWKSRLCGGNDSRVLVRTSWGSETVSGSASSVDYHLDPGRSCVTG
jgi:hypothetical protein